MRKLLLGMIFIVLGMQILYAQNNEVHNNPPGTIKVKYNFYVDQTETLNIHWLEFMHYIKQDSILAYDLAPKDNLNFEHPYYMHYPIYNITYKQVMMYCQWRSEVVSEKLKKKVVYRLPTPAEWNQIAALELKKLSDKKKTKSNKTGKLRVSRNHFSSEKKKANNIFELFDNLSEMTSVEGVAKGGNYAKQIQYLENINQAEIYQEYSKTVGFRCVAEYVE